MQKDNYISTVKFDITFSSSEKSTVLQNKFSSIFNSMTAFEIDKLLTKNTGSELIYLDSIEIDLGEILYERIEFELSQKIILKLNEALNNINHVFDQKKRITNSTYIFNAIEDFLLHGYVTENGFRDINDILDYLHILLSSKTSEFIDLLKRIGNRESVAKRIVYQLGEETTLEIIKTLQPDKIEYIFSYISALQKIQKKESIVKAQQSEFRKSNLLFVLNFLINKRGSVFNTKYFIKSQIKQMAAYYNLSYNELLMLLYKSASAVFVSRSELNIYSYIRDIFAEDYLISEKHTVSEMDNNFSYTEGSQVENKLLIQGAILYFIKNGYWPNRFNGINQKQIEESFNILINENFSELKRVINPTVLLSKGHYIIRFFTRKSVRDYIAKIQPNNKQSVLKIIAGLENSLLIQKIINTDSKITISEATLFALQKTEGQQLDNEKFIAEIIFYLSVKKYLRPLNNKAIRFEKHKEEQNEILLVFQNELNKKSSTLLPKIGRLTETQEYTLSYFDAHKYAEHLWNKLKISNISIEELISKTDFFKIIDADKKKLYKKSSIKIVIDKLKERIKLKTNIDVERNLPIIKKEIEIIDKVSLILNQEIYSSLMQIQLIKYFLFYGKMPWWFEKEGIAEFKKIWAKEFHYKQATWIANFINENKGVKNIYKNIQSIYTEEEFTRQIVFINTENTAILPILKQLIDKKTIDTINSLALYFNLFLLKDSHPSTYRQSIANSINVRKEISAITNFLSAIYNYNKKLLNSTFASWLIHLLGDVTVFTPDLKNKKSTAWWEEQTKALVYKPKQITTYEKGFAETNDEQYQSLVNMFFSAVNTNYYTGVNEIQSLLNSLIEKIQQKTTEKVYTEYLIKILQIKKIRKSIIQYADINDVHKMAQISFGSQYKLIMPLYKDFRNNIYKLTLGIDSVEKVKWLNDVTFQFFLTKNGAFVTSNEYLLFLLKHFKTEWKAQYQNMLNVVLTDDSYNKNLSHTLLPIMMHEVIKQKKKLKKEQKTKTENNQEENKLELKATYVNNAGIVILWPFLQHYFTSLKLMHEGQFISKKCQIRAVYLLSFLVKGNAQSLEFELTLLKFLCNLPPDFPILEPKSLKKHEKELSKELLKTAIERWTIIKDTTIDGFRESFLSRNGKLVKEEEQTILIIEKKSFDMLLEKLPWSISTVRLPWLAKPLIVNWRV